MSHLVKLYQYDINRIRLNKNKQFDFGSLGIYISTSHSEDFAIACLDSEKPVGIEIKVPQENLSRIKHFFLNVKESQFYNEDFKVINMLFATKRSVRKVYYNECVSLKNDIIIESKTHGAKKTILGFVSKQPFEAICEIKDFFIISICRKLFRI